MSFGGGGGGSSGTQVQRNEPSSVQAPYLTDLYRQAQKQFQAGPQQFFPGQTYAAPSDTTLAAEEATSANDPAGSTGASFKLYLSAANSHIAFKGIITGTSFGATVGELQTASVSFITSGPITVTLASD